ncbi:MAG: bi-domain-containing oxidoreductase [Idiomarina sp.]|nr:bi-domain-containing oxidoreductase [Idiomarina sp.]
MKQILQSLKNGSTQIADVPAPSITQDSLLIHSHASLVSAGTERMLVDFGKANWVNKARQQPDKVRMVLNKVRTDGLATTVDAVKSKLDQPLPLGYCNVGTVVQLGKKVDKIAIGDRVVSNGHHAQVVSVSKNLCAKIPSNVSDEAASFTVLGAIGLQGIRLVNPTVGECVVVTGLGLIGLLTVQMLRASGCRVLGIDFDESRLAMARQFGAETVNPGYGEDVLAKALEFSRGRGVDAVLITASTQSSEPVSQAAHMCRKRGRIVLVGVTGLELSRADFYEKELTFQVSCSYGPGRYDSDYEERGFDYPVGFVRWTEQRNFEAFLDLLSSGAVNVDPLITHRFDIESATDAYDLLSSGKPSLGIILNYPDRERNLDKIVSTGAASTIKVRSHAGESIGVSFLGAGNYAGRVLIPAFKQDGVELNAVVSQAGVSAVHYGKKYGFKQAATDVGAVLADESTDAVVIATRHDAHAAQVLEAIHANKHVFCEKPLCLTADELFEIESAANAKPDLAVMVGYNRRFAPQIQKMKSLLANVNQPKSFVLTMNAGAVPADHWTQDPAIGGGRVVGEACHYIDLMRFLAGSVIVSVQARRMSQPDASGIADDKAAIILGFADGSFGTINYLANGASSFPKERVEVFAGGRVLQLDNFRKLRGFGWPNFKKMNLWRQDKGQMHCAGAFIQAIRNGSEAPIPRHEIFEVARETLKIANLLREQE